MKPTATLFKLFLGSAVLILTFSQTTFTDIASSAAAGDLDPSFGSNGKVATDFGGSGDYVFAVALQPDGKIVAAGRKILDSHSDFALARYNPDGSLDASFGTSGRVTTHFNGGYNDTVTDIALKPDGKIVAVGSIVGDSGAGLDIALVCYNPDGSLDTSFGSGGKVTTDLGTDEEAHAIALEADGRVVVAGQTGNYYLANIALTRYNPNGSLDTSFGTNGAVITHFNGGYNVSVRDFDVALQPDGKIVSVGYYQEDYGTDNDFALTRYNPDGSLDATFGNGGEVITDFAGTDDDAFAIALQPDGKIIATGFTRIGYRNNDIATARYNPDGSLDTSFANNGKVTTAFSATSSDLSYSIAYQPDGKIIIAGETGNYPIFDFALVRYTGDGQLDSSFGSNGKVATDFFGQSDQSYAVALQPDSKIVVAGLTQQGSSPLDFGLARYLSPAPCACSLSSASVHLPSRGGSGSINLTTGSGCVWQATSNAGWIVITSPEGGSGNATVSFEARENLTSNARSGTLTIAGQSFTVIQDGVPGEACSYSISPTNNSFSAAGGTGVIDLAAGEQCAWQATSNAGWITITSSSSGIGKGAVSYTVAANPGSGGRKGTVVVAGQTFSVKQKGG